MSQLTTFKSRRNGNTLVIENHLFNLAKENKNGSSRWYCKYRKNKSVLCKVVAVTFGSCIVESIDGEHNHPAYNDAEIIFKSARSDLIESGKQSSKLSAQSICIVAVSYLIKEHNLDPTDQDVSKAATIIKSNS